VVKHIFCFLFLLLSISNIILSQDKIRFDQLPVSTQNGFKQIAAKCHSGEVNYLIVENGLKNSGIDFSRMNIEDAVMMMFMLIADDARKDVKDMLEEMNSARLKRSALRQAEELLKKEIDSLRNQARTKYDSIHTKENINAKLIKLQQYSIQDSEIKATEDTVTIKRTATEKHLQSVEEAINKLRQQQSRRKPM
jgi:acyl-homoserine lactone acylase PvdQ